MKRNLIILGALILGPLTVFAEEANPYTRFRAEYLKCEAPNARRMICLKAIDDNLISIGVPLAKVETMFGVEKGGINEDNVQHFEKRILIHFAAFGGNIASGGRLVSGPWDGWYLYLRYRLQEGNAVITNYYLSNTWRAVKGLEGERYEQSDSATGARSFIPDSGMESPPPEEVNRTSQPLPDGGHVNRTSQP
ncbi:MAG: hypothetical protein ABI222_07835 [Opitutaceae bacterium]